MGLREDLKKDLRPGRTVVFIGGGTTIFALTERRERGSWIWLLESGIDHCVSLSGDLKPWAERRRQQLATRNVNELIAAAEMIQQQLIDLGEYARWLKDTVGVMVDEPLDRRLADALARLGVPIATTNYDTIPEGLLGRASVYWTQSAMAQAWLREPETKSVLHLHGVWNHPDSVILGIRDYDRIVRDEHTQSLMRALWTGWTILFIGFGDSLSDPNFAAFLAWARRVFGQSPYRHYRLAKEDEVERLQAERNGIAVVSYGAEFSDLPKFLEELAEPAKPLPPPPRQTERLFTVPFPSKGKGVVGLDRALAAIRRSLESPSKFGSVAVLAGIGGLGKTQMAVEFCHANRDAYAEGVFWIDCARDIDTQLIRFAESAGWIHPEASPADKLGAAKHRVSQLSNALIVLDDVSDAADVKSRFFRSAPATLHMLLTSKAPVPPVTSVPPEELTITHAEALALLRLESNRTIADDDADAETLIKLFEALPLAIEIAGAYLSEGPSITLRDYALTVDQRGLNAPGMSPEEIASFTDHSPNLRKAVELNDEIARTQPLLSNVLACFGLTPNRSIGRSLLAAMLGVPNVNVQLTAALDRANLLRILRREDRADGTECWRMHRLVWEVYHIKATAKFEEAEMVAMARRIVLWFRERYENTEHVAEFEAEAEQIRFWGERMLQRDEALLAAELIWMQAYLPFHRGYYLESIPLVDKARAIIESDAAVNKPLLVRVLSDRASLAALIGKPEEGLRAAFSAASLARELPVGNEEVVVEALLALYAIQRDLGDFRESLDTAMEALRRSDAADKQRQIASTVRVGEALRRLDRSKEAFDLVREREATLAPFGNELAGLLESEKAHCLLANGDTVAAVAVYERALQISESLYGQRHPETIIDMHHLGAAVVSSEPERALRYFETVLEIATDLQGPNHPSVGMYHSDMASALSRLDKHEEAVNYARRGLEIIEESRGADHPHTGTAASYLASALLRARQTDKAVKQYERCISIAASVYGYDHSRTVNAIRATAGALVQAGESKRALSIVHAYAGKLPKASRNRKALIDYENDLLRETAIPGFRKKSKKR